MLSSGLRRQVGQLVTLGIAGHMCPVELRSLARDFDVGGVILFSRNVGTPEQVAELAFDIQMLVADPAPWVAVDQEGGRVARLRAPFTEWPAMHTLGRNGSEDLADRFAQALGRELRSVGITLDFAPVLDILTNPANPAIGDRALAADAETVARLGSAIIRALQREGVAACGKHFPGHGDTAVDSHHELPVVEHGPDRLRAIEYQPFKAAITVDVAAIMVGHLLVPALDADWPASLSRRVVTGELRDGLGFDGLIVIDDTYMKGCQTRLAPPAAAVQAVAAGHDMVLLCTPNVDDQAAALEALVHAVESGTLPVAQVERSIARHRRWKARVMPPAGGRRRPSGQWRRVIGCEAHQTIAAEMAQHA
jgi:beta-N-acetylhexosaminidase